MKNILTASVSTLIIGLSMSSCTPGAKIFSAKGTVQAIEQGKDGYTAALKDDKGQDFDAVISRVKMQTGYKTLQPGDVVTLYGDTIRLDSRLRVLVNKIEP